jgi:predicted DNA-binding WGR domain protein
MSNLDYAFIGWCRDEEENHDKVWGAIKLKNGDSRWSDNSYVTFWGRRGKKLQTKIVTDSAWNMDKVFDKKRDKGYAPVDIKKLNEVYPEFEDDLSKTAFWAMFKV